MFETRNRQRDHFRDPLPRQRHWIGAFVYVLIGGVVGFIAGRFGRTALPDLHPDTKWDIVALLNIVVTLVVAMYLQHWVVARGESAKAHRSHLAALAGSCESVIRDLHKLVRARAEVEGEVILLALRSVNNAIVLLRNALMMTNATCSIKEFEGEWRRYGQILDDYPWVPLTELRRISIERSFQNLLTLVTRIIFELHA